MGSRESGSLAVTGVLRAKMSRKQPFWVFPSIFFFQFVAET